MFVWAMAWDGDGVGYLPLFTATEKYEIILTKGIKPATSIASICIIQLLHDEFHWLSPDSYAE